MTIPKVIKPHAKPLLPRSKRPAYARVPAPSGLVDPIKRWRELHQLGRQVAAEKDEIEAQIRPVAEDTRQSHCQSKGDVVNTVILETPDGSVRVTNQNRYRAIDPKVMPELKAVFGDETSKLVKSKLRIRFTEEGLKDETLLQKIVEAVGEENLAKYFDIREELSPTDEFHVRRHTDSSFARKANSAIDQGLITPVKQSVRPE